MFEKLFGTGEPRGLLRDALEETDGMIEREEKMFAAACEALLQGREPDIDVVGQDEDIDVGERMVRRLVIEHITMNPTEDLPASLALLSVVHDVERIGDYTKSLLYLTRWWTDGSDVHRNATRELRDMITPMFDGTKNALRESDVAKARWVMQQNRQVKAKTSEIQQTLLQESGEGRSALVCSNAAQYLRRISAHLSNIASSVANPFDRLGGNEA